MRVRQGARRASADGFHKPKGKGPLRQMDQLRTTEREWLWQPKNVGWADAASAASAWGGSGPSTTIPAPRQPDRLNHN